VSTSRSPRTTSKQETLPPTSSRCDVATCPPRSLHPTVPATPSSSSLRSRTPASSRLRTRAADPRDTTRFASPDRHALIAGPVVVRYLLILKRSAWRSSRDAASLRDKLVGPPTGSSAFPISRASSRASSVRVPCSSSGAFHTVPPHEFQPTRVADPHRIGVLIVTRVIGRSARDPIRRFLDVYRRPSRRRCGSVANKKKWAARWSS